MTVPGSANPLLLRSAAPTAYQVSRSLRFNSADSAYLSRTPASAGNRKTWTFSCWVKRSSLGARQVIFGTGDASFNNANWIEFFSTDALRIGDYTTATQYDVITTQVFRDVSAWGHLVVAVDTTQATASNRVRVYWNGSEITTFSTATYPTQNLDTQLNTTTAHGIGRGGTYNAQYFNGYLAECHFINGSQLTPSSFGETDANGEWQPKLYSGSYNTNGFKLTFADNSNTTAATLGADTSGNGNNYTPTNFSVTAGAGNDSLTDTPTSYGSGTSGGDVRGNFCTWNPLNIAGGALANGNLDLTNTGGGRKVGTIAVSSGKWYWEVTVTSAGDAMIGIMPPSNPASTASANFLGGAANEYGYYATNGQKYNNNSATAYGATFANGDVIGVALDMDAGTLVFYKNGTSQGTAFSGLSGTFAPGASAGGSSGASMTLNAGQRAFAYTPPANHKPLVDTYLPTPTVAKPNTVMDVALWTGNGSARSITGLGFNPDLVWIKGRSGATDHALYDVVRGAQARLESNTTDAEVTSDGGVTAFNSDGFSLGTLAQVNTNSATYAGWAWDAGTTTSSNGSGSITSSVRANASAGFSIVTATCASGTNSYGHGLGVKPAMYIVKNRSASQNWQIWHQGLSNETSAYLQFTTAAQQTLVNMWAASTSTTISLVGGNPVTVGDNFVAYVFAPVAGYSSFGVWQHNNSNDGPFIYTGFRPKLILLKNSDNAEQWFMFDSARRTYNLAAGTDTSNLRPNSSGAEGSYSNQATIDFLSNGFKIRTTTPDEIAFGTRSYIYAAWAESPFQYARAR